MYAPYIHIYGDDNRPIQNGLYVTPLTDMVYTKGEVDGMLANFVPPAPAPVPVPEGPSAYTLQTVHVNKGGDDADADGTEASAFATVGAALASISDSGAEKRYVVQVGPGNFAEAGFGLKAYVHVRGLGMHTRLQLTSDVTLDPGFEGGRTGLSDLLLSQCGLDVECDGVETAVELAGVHIEGPLSFSGRTDADTLEVWQSQCLGPVALHAGQAFVKNSYMPVAVTVDTVGATDSTTVNIENSTVNTLAVSSAHPLHVSFTGGTIYTSLAVHGGTTIYTTDLMPAAAKLTGTPTIVLTATSEGVAYAPGTPSRWAVQPTTVAEALDRLAAKIFSAAGTI